MSITKPTRWADVPAAVRAALADLTAARKAAGELPVLSQLADAAGWRAGPINAFWGGPRPLANMLVGSALGGLGGYGVGRIAEKFLPPEYFEPGAIRRRAALLGAGLGGVPGLYQWYDNYSQNKGPGGPAGKALDAVVTPWPPPAAQPDGLEKAADMFGAVIDRDRFSGEVMGDPYTPLPIRAATAGLVEAAAAVRGSRVVSPWDVARVAVGAGAGLASGVVAGKVLGTLAGLNDAGRRAVQQTGLWAGLITAAVPPALNLR